MTESSIDIASAHLECTERRLEIGCGWGERGQTLEYRESLFVAALFSQAPGKIRDYPQLLGSPLGCSAERNPPGEPFFNQFIGHDIDSPILPRAGIQVIRD